MKSSTFAFAFTLLGTISIATGAIAQPPAAETRHSPPAMVVYHDPACGCCTLWMEHMREAGFEVRAKTTGELNTTKQRLGVPAHLRSCHTAIVDGRVIEGHVPATDVRRLLLEQPEIAGIGVPGMPLGSPGMENGDRRQAFDVLVFDETGETMVYRHYPANRQ